MSPTLTGWVSELLCLQHWLGEWANCCVSNTDWVSEWVVMSPTLTGWVSELLCLQHWVNERVVVSPTLTEWVSELLCLQHWLGEWVVVSPTLTGWVSCCVSNTDWVSELLLCLQHWLTEWVVVVCSTNKAALKRLAELFQESDYLGSYHLTDILLVSLANLTMSSTPA